MKRPRLFFALVKSAFSPPIFIDSVKTGLAVGLILNLINHGQALLDGTEIGLGSVLLDFIVPFCVSAYSGARAAYSTCGLPNRVPAENGVEPLTTTTDLLKPPGGGSVSRR